MSRLLEFMLLLLHTYHQDECPHCFKSRLGAPLFKKDNEKLDYFFLSSHTFFLHSLHMSVDHAISFSRLALAKAIKTSDVRDGDNDHKPWTKSVISHQPHVESKMLQTMQNPMRRLLSRHFPKRRSAPITPSTTDDDTPSKHSLHVDEPSPELSKYTLPRPILQDNTMHRDKYHSMHRRTSSTPPSQSLSSAAAAANTKQPLRSCLKRTSKSAGKV